MSSYRSGGIQSIPMLKGKNCPRCLQSIRVNGEAQLSYAGFSFIVRGNADVIIQEADGMYEDRNGFGCGEDPGPGYGRQSAARKRRVPYRRKSELPLDDPFCNSAETAENAQLDERANAAGTIPSDEEIEVAVKKRRPFAMVCKQEPHDTSYGTVDLVNQLATSSGKSVQQQDVTAIDTYTYMYGDGEEESGIPFPQDSSTPRARGGTETAYNPHPGTMDYREPARRRRPANSNVYNYNYPTAVWQQMVNAGHPLYKSVSSITNAYVTMPSEHFLGGISLRDTFERVQQNILRSVVERRCRKPSIISAWRIVISSIVYAMLRCKEHIKIVTVREKSVANPLVDLTETPGDEKNVHRLLREDMLENEEESFSFHKKEKFKEKVIANAAEDAAKRKKRKRMIKERREQDLIGVIEDKEKKIKKKKVKKLIDEGKILLHSDEEAENPSDEILERFGALVDREEKLAENGPESNTELAYDGTLEAVQDGDVVLEGGGTFTSITGEAIIDGKLCKHPPYSVSLAIPGTFLNIGQSPELRTYMAGQIARAATVFCVDEIVVYDETAQMTQKQVDSYWSGDWLGGNPPSENNVEANFYLAKVLEYLECPQYLRKKLFYHHRALKYAGLLNPLDSEHHFKADDTVKYREGIVVNKRTRENKGVLVDVGLEQECWVPDMIPAGTRVTVEIDQFAGKQGGRLNKGRLISANKVKKATGQYWGYNVRIAKNLKQVIDRERYDYIFGTSSKGEPIEDIHINLLSRPKILIVFACRGVDQAVEIDEEIPTQNAEEVFDKLINPLPLHSGSGSERMEENVLITMSALTMKLKTLQ